MLKNSDVFTARSVAAGMLIAIAAIVNLNCADPVAGAFLFGFGLLTIVLYQCKLFTGVIGYTANQRGKKIISYLLSCAAVWLGNFIGAIIIARLYCATSKAAKILPKVTEMVNAKIADTTCSLFVLGILCGVLMYLAVNTFNKEDKVHPLCKTVILFLCVAVFILSGYEHSIADMAYCALTTAIPNAPILKMLLIVTAGNSVGGIAAAMIRNAIR